MIAAILGVALLVIYFFPPGQYAFYPRCLFNSLTGLLCPGCGSLRATHQALQGNLAAAFQLNPLLLILVPWLMVLSLSKLLQPGRGKRFFARLEHSFWIWVVLAILIGFTVLRNLRLLPSAAW